MVIALIILWIIFCVKENWMKISDNLISIIIFLNIISCCFALPTDMKYKFNDYFMNGRIKYSVEHIFPGKSAKETESIRERLITEYKNEGKYDEKGKKEIEKTVNSYIKGGTLRFPVEMYFNKDQIVMKEYSKDPLNIFYDFNRQVSEFLAVELNTLNRKVLYPPQAYYYDSLYIRWLGGFYDQFLNSSDAVFSEDTLGHYKLISVPVSDSLKNVIYDAEQIVIFLNSTTNNWEKIELWKSNINNRTIIFSDYQTYKGINYPNTITIEELREKNKKDIYQMKVQEVEFNLPHLDVYGQMNIQKGKTTVIDERFSPSVMYKIEESGDKKDEELVEMYKIREMNLAQNSLNNNIPPGKLPNKQTQKEPVTFRLLKYSFIGLVLLLSIWGYGKIRNKN